jgi:hypothetical protein
LTSTSFAIEDMGFPDGFGIVRKADNVVMLKVIPTRGKALLERRTITVPTKPNTR